MLMDKRSAGDADETLDLRALRIFAAVAETGSMTAAARLTGLSQPAVSQAVARLEKDLGTVLFERGRRPLVLTPAGEALRAGARGLLAASVELRQDALHAAERAPSSVRLGLIDSFAATVGPRLVRTLRGQAERITLWSGISPGLWADLQDRRLDFMVASEPMNLVTSARRWKLVTEPFVLVLPKLLARHVTRPSLAELAGNHPFVRYSIRSHIGAQIERALAARRVEPPQSMEFDGTDALFAMVAAGLGWAITTPLCLAHGRGYADALAVMTMPGKQFSRTLYLISGPDSRPAVGARIAAEARRILLELVGGEIGALVPRAADAIVVHD
jgi:DNA-binding transcriptional LysR family regulator